MSVRTINSFKFQHESHNKDNTAILFELKFNDFTQSANKADRYQWYLVFDEKRYDLQLNKIKDGVRYFSIPKNNHMIELKLNIDHMIMTISYQDGTVLLYSLTKY